MAAVSAVAPVDSNIVVFEIIETGPSAVELVETSAAAGVDFSDLSARTCRIVTHMDVDDDDEAALLSVLGERAVVTTRPKSGRTFGKERRVYRTLEPKELSIRRSARVPMLPPLMTTPTR